MKISDNLLRTISHAYRVLTPTQFIIKSDIIQFEDDNIKIKALEVADMIARLTRNPITETEKKFYKHTISVEEYNRELVVERRNNPEIETIKESILRNGLVHSPFLRYIYNSLVKYEPTKIDLSLLEDSLDKTHQKLTEIIGTNGKPAKKLTREEIETKLENLDNEVDVFYSNIKEVTVNVVENNDSISKIKETINALKTLQLDKANTQDTLDIHQDLNTIYKGINENLNENISKQIQDALKNQSELLISTVLKQIDKTDTQELQRHTTKVVEDKIESMLSTTESKLKEDINRIEKSITTNRKLDNILEIIQALIAKSNNLAEDPNLARLAKAALTLANSLESVDLNNQAQTDLITADLDSIESYLNPINNTYNDAYENYKNI